jgi:hypothetical protein
MRGSYHWHYGSNYHDKKIFTKFVNSSKHHASLDSPPSEEWYWNWNIGLKNMWKPLRLTSSLKWIVHFSLNICESRGVIEERNIERKLIIKLTSYLFIGTIFMEFFIVNGNNRIILMFIFCIDSLGIMEKRVIKTNLFSKILLRRWIRLRTINVIPNF